MSFFGKEYTFDRQENFEAFVESLGLPEEYANGFLSYHPNQKLLQDGDSLTLVTGEKNVTFQSGVPFEENVADRTCEATYTLDGNTLTQVQKFAEGEFQFVREYSDDQLVVTITSTKFDGTAQRFYKAV